MKRWAITVLSLLLSTIAIHISAKQPSSNVHYPQILTTNYQTQTVKPERKISMQYSLVDSSRPSAKHLNDLIHKMLKQKEMRFINDSKETVLNFVSSLQINDKVLYYKPRKLISILYEEYSYISGAAHPNTTHFVLNYDIATNHRLKLQDILLIPQKDLEYISELCIKSLKTKNLGTENFIKEGAKPTFHNYRNWNFTDKGLLIMFDTYQVAAYVYGPQSVVIPYYMLKGHLKPQYYQIVS